MSKTGQGSIKRLVASSSFRIVTLFSVFFVFSGMLVTSLSGLHSQSLLRQQLEQTVQNEGEETFASAGGRDVAHLLPVVQGFVLHEPGFFYLLQDRNQTVVAGNMLHLRPVAGPRWLAWAHRLPRSENQSRVYGVGYKLTDGGYYFVGIDASPLARLKHALWTTVLWGIVGFGILGVAGGLLLSHVVLHWIESISLTARSIMRGNMARRIPLRGTGDELDHLSQSLNALFAQNEALINSLHQVSNDIAHDMRRPLSRVRNILDQTLEKDMKLPQVKSRIGLSIENLDSALEIFSSLLKLAKLESGTWKDSVQTLDMAELVDGVLEPYYSVVEDQAQTLSVSIVPVKPIAGHRVLLRQAIANLIENAVTYSGKNSIITVSVFPSGQQTCVVVADNGIGIPTHDYKRVFERFVRLDQSRNQQGNGLGLSLVQAIVRLHGGTIVLSNNAPGLKCTLSLPIFRKNGVRA